MGAEPKYLSVGFILQEGFELEKLERIAVSMAKTAPQANVAIITGDTKVVPRKDADGVFINTAGVGFVANDAVLSVASIKPGDAVVVSGPGCFTPPRIERSAPSGYPFFFHRFSFFGAQSATKASHVANCPIYILPKTMLDVCFRASLPGGNALAYGWGDANFLGGDLEHGLQSIHLVWSQQSCSFFESAR